MVSQLSLTITDAAGISVNARSLLAAIASPAPGQMATLTEPGYEGMFVFDDADRSAAVALDAEEFDLVASAEDVTGASGA